MNALDPGVGPKLLPSPHLVSFRDIVRLYSSPIIGFRSKLNRRSKTGFSRDYTFRENDLGAIPELDRRNLHRRWQTGNRRYDLAER